MSDSSPHQELELTWQDINTNDRMTFTSVEQMESFFRWKSGQLEEQLETYEKALQEIAKDYGMSLGLGRIARAALNPAINPTYADKHKLVDYATGEVTEVEIKTTPTPDPASRQDA